MKKFWQELKRRNVIRETIAYILVAWIVLQVAAIVLPVFEAPEWILKTLTIVLIAGIPFAMAFSWVYELTSKGLQKTKDRGDQALTKKQHRKLNGLIALAGTVAVVLFFIIGSRVKQVAEAPDYSIAILPFENLSAENDQQWFIEGLRDDIWERLVQIEDMEPRSNRSTSALKSAEQTNREMAVRLNVQYLLEGSVRTMGDQAVIKLQLWDKDDQLVWNDEYNEPFKNFFALQKFLARDIVEAMAFTIGPEEEDILESSETQDLEAYRLTKKGERLVLNNKYWEAIPVLEDAIKLDSSYANAYGSLAYAYTTKSWHFEDSFQEDVELTRLYAEKSLHLDQHNSRANTALAVLEEIIYDNRTKALEYMKKALEARPNDGFLQFMIGDLYYFGVPRDLDKALAHHKRAFELDPLEWKFGRELIEDYARIGRYEDAIDVVNQWVLLWPEEDRALIEEDKIAELAMYENEDRKAHLDFLLKQAQKDSLNPSWYTQLAIHYDWYLNDNSNYLKYAKKAYERDPKNRTIHYSGALIENGMFEEAADLFKTTHFQQQPRNKQLSILQKYYAIQGQYEDLRQLIDTTELGQNTLNEFWYQARKGSIKNIEESGISGYELSVKDKATFYAITGNKDSLYYYLNHPVIESFLEVNSMHEFDPYREDPEYKAFQKKYYLE